MKKIMINGMGAYIDDEPHGPQRFAKQLLIALDIIAMNTGAENIYVIAPSYLEGRIELNKLNIIYLKQNESMPKRGFVFNNILFPQYVRKNKGVGIDITLSYPIKGCIATVVHDCIIKEHPEECIHFKDKMFRLKFLVREKRCISNCKIVFTASEHSKKEINRLYGIPMKQIVVLGNSWQHIADIKQDDSIVLRNGLKKKDYFFTAGVGLDRKNFRWIIAAANNNPRMKFVISGGYSSRLLADYEVKKENIITVGYVNDSEYKALMANCKAYIQPSLYEGFGIPPLEALSVNTEIIVSDIPVFREIYGETAHYINPLKYEDIRMEKILSSNVCDNNEVLEKYSWEKIAQTFYTSLVVV